MKRIISAVLAALIAVVTLTTTVSADEWDDFLNEFLFGTDEYNGMETIEFSENSKLDIVSESDNGLYIQISWNYVTNSNSGGYVLYKRVNGEGKYKKLTEFANYYTNQYYDYDIEPNTKYQYKVKAYSNGSGNSTDDRKYTKLSSSASFTTGVIAPKISIKTTSKKVTVLWDKVDGADGYEVYYCRHEAGSLKENDYSTSYNGGWDETMHFSTQIENSAHRDSDFKLRKRVDSEGYAINRKTSYDYFFKVRSYEVVDGKRVYSGFSNIVTSSSIEAYLNRSNLTPKSTVQVVSYRSDDGNWTMTISDNDKKIMDKFAKENFTEDMSVYDKLVCVNEYVGENYTYASSYEQLNEISGLSCVEAMFEHHLGQCLQYNGAVIEFAAYLGLDARLVHGFKSVDVGHFWGEIKVNGRYYCLETPYATAMPYEWMGGYMYYGEEITESPKA